MTAFSTNLCNGALPRLRELYLYENQIGDAGMEAFAAALGGGSGAMANLTHLNLCANPPP